MRRIPVTIWFGGHPAEAPPALIENLLRSCRLRDLVPVRLEEATGDAAVSIDVAGADLDRYRSAARAPEAFRLRHPRWEADRALEKLLDEQVACRIAHGLLVEGRYAPELRADLAVYVMRPLPAGQRLVERREKEVMRLSLPAFLQIEGLATEAPVAVEEEDTAADAEVVEELEATPERVAEITGLDLEGASLLLEAAERGVPIRAERWTLHPEHEDIGQADMVVIDTRDEKERAAAESLQQQVRRLRADSSVRLDLGLDFGQRRPGVYIADLSNPRDPELKKALVRIKRLLPTDNDEDWR